MLTTSHREPTHRLARILGIAIAAMPLVVVLLALTGPRLAGAADCATDHVKIGIVEAQGCFSSRTPDGEAPVYETTEKFRMNGFDVEPVSGAKVTFSPADDVRRGASVTTNGFVDLSASHPVWGPIHFRGLALAFSPPVSGQVTVAESALAQPYAFISGLTPLAVKQPIRLTQGGAKFGLSFSVGGVFGDIITGTVKRIAFMVDFDVKDGQFHIASGKFGTRDFELANLLKVREAAFDFGPEKIAADLDVVLKGIEDGDKGLIGGATFEKADGAFKLTRFSLGLPFPDIALGTSGIFLQGFAAEVFTAPPFGGKGIVGLTAGPNTRFLGRNVAAMAADGSIEVRGADPQARKPGFFRVAGDFKVVSVPAGNANFAYYFGQGTEFGVNFGIGLPSGTNDPGQPTYIGGGFKGWTTAQHFDVEGTAKLKLLGWDAAGVDAVVSDIGLAGCIGSGVFRIGGGVRWSDGRAELLVAWACDIGRYRPLRSAALRAAATGSATLKLGSGPRVVRLTAAEGEAAAHATLTHADGRTLATPEPGDEDGMERSEHGITIRALDGTSAFVLRDGGGAWRLEQLPGSSDVETIEVAKPLPKHRVRATVTGKGRQRVLRWSAREIPDQTLQFSERLPDGREIPILRTRKASGKRRFLPVEGPGTYGVKRRLAVDVRQRLNTPRDELIAHRYVIRRQPAPQRARIVRAKRRLHDLVVRWKRSRRAASYRVVARAGGGAAYVNEVAGNRRRLRMPVGATEKLRATVTPVNAQGREGKPGKRVIDTEGLVPTRRAAVRRMVRGATVTRRGRVFAHPACPASGHCDVTLRVKLGKRTLGTGRLSLPPDLTDRLAVELSPGASAKLRRARLGTVRLHGKVEQVDGNATYRSSR